MTAVDIVIVNWNSGGQLADCLGSLEQASGAPELQISTCIVVDNASQDGSANGPGQPGFDVRLIRNAENRGFGAACNQGAAAGTGEYVLFLNPDIRLGPNSLAGPVAFMRASPQAGLLGVQLVDEQCRVQPSAGRFPTPWRLLYQMAGLDRLWPRRFPPFIMTDWDHEQSREVDVLQGALLLARRAAFEQAGGFDEGFFMYYEDVDLAYRMKQAGWGSYYLAEAQAFHRGGGTTEAIQAERLSYWLTSRVRYAAKHFGGGAAVAVAAASLTLELAARVAWNLLHLSRGHLLDTLRAYGKYVQTLPGLLRT